MSNINSVGNTLSSQTGTGLFVGQTSPSLVTPALGTPSSGNLVNCTGYPGAGITTINADTGSVTGATVTISAGTAAITSGGSVSFTDSGTTSTLNLSDTTNVNTYIGYQCGGLAGTSTHGTGNTIVGYQSMPTPTNSALFNVGVGRNVFHAASMSGTYNTAIGYGSSASFLNGTNNTCLGYATATAYVGSESENIIIGSLVAGTISESNKLRIGNQFSAGAGINASFIAGIAGGTFGGGAVPAITLINTNDGQLISTQTGTGVVTALGVNVGTSGSFVVNGGALGTPSSGNLSNCTNIPGQSSMIGVPLMSGSVSDNYVSIWGSNFSGATPQLVNIVAPANGTMSKLYINIYTNTDAGARNFTFYKSNSATALTLATTAGTTGVVSDVTHSVSVSAGDLICFLLSSGTGVFTASASCLFTPT